MNRCELVTFVEASESRYCECDKELCNGSVKIAVISLHMALIVVIVKLLI